MSEKGYWHLNRENIQIPADQWDEAMGHFIKPDWCGEEDALKMKKGCLILMFKRHKINEYFCEGCTSFKKVEV